MKQTDLIEIQTTELNNETIQTVNARELHAYLESKQDFSTWIKKRITEYDFVENMDFVKLHKKMELSKTGQYAIEYHISLDMAKELSMVERNEKGKQARQYFIDCEKKVKQQPKAIKVDNSGLPEYRKAKAIAMATQTASMICNRFSNLSEPAQQTIFAYMVNGTANRDIIPLPVLEDKTYTATEVGEMLGVSSKKIGALANQLDLKNNQYGIFVLDKSPYSNKQVESFRYNDKAVDLIKSELMMIL